MSISLKSGYFVYISYAGRLSYYIDEQAEVPSGQLDLGDAEACNLATSSDAMAPVDGWPKDMCNEASGFVINMPGRTFFFYACSTGEAQEWVQHIQVREG